MRMLVLVEGSKLGNDCFLNWRYSNCMDLGLLGSWKLFGMEDTH